MNHVDWTTSDWLAIVRSEYLEMPGLRLTRCQARRMWGLDDSTCGAILNELVMVGFLRISDDGSYTRTRFDR